MKLHLGCGEIYKEGFVNVDNCKDVKIKADVYHDLNKFPYPWDDNSADYILMEHTLQCLDDPMKVIEEFDRICKDKAIVKIKCSHFSYFFSYHISNKHRYTRHTFNMFQNPRISGTQARFKLISNDLKWTNRKCPKIINNFIGFIINRVLNTKKFDIYERFFCWIFPVEEITFILEAHK